MWKILYHPKSLKKIGKLDQKSRENIKNYLEKISKAKSPENFGKPLSANFKGYWRYRVGDYRIICDIRKKELVVLVIEVDHRSKVYRNK